MNQLLLKQVKEFLGDTVEVPEKLKPLLAAISDTYDEYEKEAAPARQLSKESIDSEHKFRSLIKNSSDAIIVTDENLQITFASDSLYRVTGYRPEDIIGLPTLSLAHPDEKEMISEFLQDVTRSPGQPKTLIYKTRKKDGSYIWCERVTTNLLHDPAVRGIVSNFRNVSEQIEYEEGLRISEHRFRTMIEHCADVIVVVDQDFRCTYCSDSLLSVTGYTPAEVKGRQCLDFVYEEDLPKYIEWTRAVLKQPGKPVHVLYRGITRDGNVIWTERVAVNLLHDPVIRGVIINFRDVTARIEYEQALTDSNEALKKTNAELDKFVYSVSHDLRAPLASVQGIIELTMLDTGDKHVHDNLVLMKESIQRLDAFIMDILDYSRNARTGVEPEEIDFQEMLGTVTRNLKYMNEGKEIDLKVNISNGFGFFSDKSRLNVIFNNLISNAIRYQNPAAAEPFVSVEVAVGEQGALITVRDNGVGIKKENQDKVFDMFFRESKNSMGSGLGLYIVREAVEKLNGTISLASEPGKGTEISICIPNNNVIVNEPGNGKLIELSHGGR